MLRQEATIVTQYYSLGGSHLKLLLVLQVLGPHSVAEVVLIVLEGLVHVDDYATVVLGTWSKTLFVHSGKHALHRVR